MSHQYRCYPKEDHQQEIFWRHCGEARLVYNLSLEQFNYWSKSSGAKAPSNSQQFRELAELRGESWLVDGSSSIQQQALRDFHQAKSNWFKGSHGRLIWRKKGQNDGFCIRDIKVKQVSKKWAEVLVPKCGWVRFRLSRVLPVEVGMARVKVNSAGQWHVSFNTKPTQVMRQKTGSAIGIDRGVVNTLTTSMEEYLHAPGTSSKQTERSLRLQRQLSRQTLGSGRRQTTKLKLGRLRVREHNRAKDWVEKTTTTLVKHHDLIVLEDLKIKQMTKSAKGTVAKPGRRVRQKAGLNRSILRQHWGLFARRLQDKASLCGVEVVKVPAPHTSDRCRKCKYQDKENRESQAVFRCLKCGHTEHADIHAAKQILELGMALLEEQKLAFAAGLAVTGRGDESRSFVCEASTIPVRGESPGLIYGEEVNKDWPFASEVAEGGLKASLTSSGQTRILEEMSEASMVHVEAYGALGSFARVVAGTNNWEEGLLFSDLYDALHRPQVEDFDVLSSDRFMLEVEMDEVSEAQGFRSKVEAILRELKLDWATAEFDEEDTMLAKKMSRLPGNWD